LILFAMQLVYLRSNRRAEPAESYGQVASKWRQVGAKSFFISHCAATTYEISPFQPCPVLSDLNICSKGYYATVLR